MLQVVFPGYMGNLKVVPVPTGPPRLTGAPGTEMTTGVISSEGLPDLGATLPSPAGNNPGSAGGCSPAWSQFWDRPLSRWAYLSSISKSRVPIIWWITCLSSSVSWFLLAGGAGPVGGHLALRPARASPYLSSSSGKSTGTVTFCRFPSCRTLRRQDPSTMWSCWRQVHTHGHVSPG